jgi:hypothetical protein
MLFKKTIICHKNLNIFYCFHNKQLRSAGITVVRNCISIFYSFGQQKVNNWTYESFINRSFILFCHITDEQAQYYGRNSSNSTITKKVDSENRRYLERIRTTPGIKYLTIYKHRSRLITA